MPEHVSIVAIISGDSAAPRASRLSAEGRAGPFPYDNVMQIAEPSQGGLLPPQGGQQAGPADIPSGNHQDGYADTQGAATVCSAV